MRRSWVDGVVVEVQTQSYQRILIYRAVLHGLDLAGDQIRLFKYLPHPSVHAKGL